MKNYKEEQHFIEAVINDDYESIKELIKRGTADVNIQDGHKDTALTLASYLNKVESVKELLKHPQINLELKDYGGMSAYDWAKRNNNKEIMLLLKTKKLKQTILNPNERK